MIHDPGSHDARMRVLAGNGTAPGGIKELPGVWPRMAHGGRIHTGHLIREGVSSDDLLAIVVSWKVRHTDSEGPSVGNVESKDIILGNVRKYDVIGSACRSGLWVSWTAWRDRLWKLRTLVVGRRMMLKRKVWRRFGRIWMSNNGVKMKKKASWTGVLMRNRLASPEWRKDARDARGKVRNLGEKWSCEMTGKSTLLNSVSSLWG